MAQPTQPETAAITSDDTVMLAYLAARFAKVTANPHPERHIWCRAVRAYLARMAELANQIERRAYGENRPD